MGFDLFTFIGWRNYWHAIRFKQWHSIRTYMWRDTFGRWLCWLSGAHVIVQSFESNSYVESHCSCCCKYVGMKNGRWVVVDPFLYRQQQAHEGKETT